MDTIEDAEDSAIIDGPPTKTRVTLPKQRGKYKDLFFVMSK
jgi:hypothetical protein